MSKRIIAVFLIVFFVLQLIPINMDHVSAQGKESLFVVPVEEGIERGLESFLTRAFKEAKESGADIIILEIDTLGGAIDAALDIGTLIQKQNIPVIAFIKGEAISAGSYISLNADKIYMQPNSFIGAAAVRTITGEEVDPKITSFWAKHMQDAAKLHGKNPAIAEGMVDPDVEIEGITKAGKLITLDSDEALQYGIADGIVNTRAELIESLGFTNPIITEIDLTPSEKIARLVTNPVVMVLLLIVGIAGIIIEIFVPGFGVPGIIGLLSFGLYFFGHIIAGFAGWETIILFLLGIILLVAEIFIPSFGILGISGIISLTFGISLAAYDTKYGLISLVIALLINIILASIMFKYFGKRGVWNKFILRDEQKKETGYVSHNNDKTLLGKKAITLTKLRPSGIAKIDGKRYDVISEGEFIDANVEVEVIFVEGTRIVVQRI